MTQLNLFSDPEPITGWCVDGPVNDDHHVMTIDREGGTWQFNALFHSFDEAKAHADELVKQPDQPKGAGVFPVRLWAELNACYTCYPEYLFQWLDEPSE